MPGAVARTSTYALTNVTLKHARMIANLGLEEASIKDPSLLLGINTYKGDLVYKQIADDLGLKYTELKLGVNCSGLPTLLKAGNCAIMTPEV